MRALVLLAALACGEPRDLNLPPVVTLHAPLDGAKVHEGVPLLLDVSIDDHGSDLPVWSTLTSDRDGVLHTSDDLEPPRRYTLELPTPSVGRHALTLTTADPHGLATTLHLGLVVNGAPSVPVIVVAPEAPGPDDDVVARVRPRSQDPEGSPVGYAWRWVQGGEVRLEGSGARARLPSDRTEPGEAWTIRFEAYEELAGARDPRGTSTVGVSTVTIAHLDTGLAPP